MQTSSLSQLKKELSSRSEAELAALCIQLAKFSKENKELLHYLLIEQEDEPAYIVSVKEKLKKEFKSLNKSSIYLVKKGVRRIQKLLNRHIKYSGKKETEIELLLFFCSELKESGLPLEKSQVLLNLYQRQLQRIQKAMESLHEDLQYDYRQQVEALEVGDL